MSMSRQTIVASRPAAMVLALSLVASLSVPFVMLPHAKAASTPLPCTENNNNGCTELSPTPPEDTVAVPPNIMLMLDDSGSMNWNFMPDWEYLNNNGQSAALIDSSNNGVYYNPTITYSPPPQNNGTLYPNQTDMTNVPADGFGTVTTVNINLYTYTGKYDYYDCNHNGASVCSGKSDIPYNMTVAGTSKAATYNNVTKSTCDSDYASTQNAYNESWSRTNGSGSSATGTCTISYYTVLPKYYFQYSTGVATGPYTVYYVAPASQGCGSQSNCVVDTDTSGSAAPAGVPVDQNIANWFAYYHTRILMAKSGLMTAFNNLDPNYRFGYGSIDGNNDSAITGLGKGNYTTSNGFYLAVVAPFGAAQITNASGQLVNNTGSQRYNFWSWIAGEKAGNGTPLQTALQAVGMYYQTSQPWSTMPGDPGYTSGSKTQFACRSSYTIMTTDGFWNGGSPGVGNVDGSNGPTYTPPSGKTYTVTGYVAVPPYSDNASNTLADVAMYYWENDLQPTIANEVAPSASDPAFWQHMTTFTMGLGFTPSGIKGTAPNGDSPPTIQDIFSWANNGGGSSSTYAIQNFAWPTPASNSINNIADLAHAAVDGHGDFFSVKSPQDLANGFAKAISEIGERQSSTAAASVNASVLAVGAVSFSTGYNTNDWSGQVEALALQSDGTVDQCSPLWNAASGSCATGQVLPQGTVDGDFHSAAGYTNRKVYTDAYDSTKPTPFSSFQFTAANVASLDPTEVAGLTTPALSGTNDTSAHRIDYLLGDTTYEGSSYRARTTSLLGAIIRSEPVYVAGATSGYINTWPTSIGGVAVTAPEDATGVQTYGAFVTQQASDTGMVYVGANDGMLHAFNAPVPVCTGGMDTTTGNCLGYTFSAGNQGHEAWAFVPRAVYANLGNLTAASNFAFRPTVDATPVTRDVFFSEGGTGNNKWHTILAGGVGLGGRGVYALDITNPTNFQAPTITSYPAAGVLWEFDSDMTIPSGTCTSIQGSAPDSIGCRASDLGYTVSEPNIGRLSNGQWVVLVSNGYFPDCGTPDTPTNDTTNCQKIAAQAPMDSSGNPYSALFVLDAQTGAVIAELKTPQISGVTSFGLATPVLGDYNGDQVDDVAFAGDVEGNLWRFDLSSTSATDWTVTLVYQGVSENGHQGVQPITTMPRLFPDPVTNRFMVVFGTGKFLGVGDNSDTDIQTLYGVRDVPGTTYTQSDLVPQYLHETTIPAGATLPDGTPNPLAGASLRCVTGNATDSCDSSTSGTSPSPINPIPASAGGWYINLQTTTTNGTVNDAGERVVVNPSAIFASNTVVFETLITGAQNSDPCSPTTVGSIIALNALTGGASGVSSLGGGNIVGGRINNARTSGSLPLVSALGGVQTYVPGAMLAPAGVTPLSVDSPMWRRRSWNEINQN